MRKLSSEFEKTADVRPVEALQPHLDALALQVRAWAGRRNRVLTLGIMGTAPKAGASTVAFSLASALAGSSFSGQVVLVEAENNRSSERIGAPGLVEILAQEKTLAECLVNSWRDNLKLLPFGNLVTGEERTGSWAKLSDLVQRELLAFDLVVFDLPPLSHSRASVPIASQLDGLLFVSGPEVGRNPEIDQLRRFLRGFPVEILGKIINRSVEAGRAR